MMEVMPALLIDGQNLIVDLIRIQIAHFFESCRGAETAVQTASHLT